MTINATINPKAAAMAALVCAVKDVRYWLEGVYIEPRESGGIYVTATNGSLLVSVADPGGTCDAPVLVKLDKGTITACKHKKAIALVIAGDDETAIVEGAGHLARCEILDEKYPDWRAVVPAALPEAAPAVTPAFASAYVGLLAQVAGIAAGPLAGFRIHYETEHTRACVTFCHTLNLNIRAVVMPQTQYPPIWLA